MHESESVPMARHTEAELSALEADHRRGAGMSTRDQGRLLREVRELRRAVAEWMSLGVAVRDQVLEMLEARD